MSTPKKRIAAQLRELKKKGLTSEAAKRLADILEHPELSALDIYTYIASIKKECSNAYQMNNVANTLINWHKVHHGDKQNVQAQNLTLNQVTINIVKPEEKG